MFGHDQTVLVAFPGEFAAVAICSKARPAGDAPFEERAYGLDGALMSMFRAVDPYRKKTTGNARMRHAL